MYLLNVIVSVICFSDFLLNYWVRLRVFISEKQSRLYILYIINYSWVSHLVHKKNTTLPLHFETNSVAIASSTKVSKIHALLVKCWLSILNCIPLRIKFISSSQKSLKNVFLSNVFFFFLNYYYYCIRFIMFEIPTWKCVIKWLLNQWFRQVICT